MILHILHNFFDYQGSNDDHLLPTKAPVPASIDSLRRR
jgi:hypothetical protein